MKKVWRIRDRKDFETLYKMEGETLKGIIYEPDESDDLMLVFDKHTINLASDGVISIEERK